MEYTRLGNSGLQVSRIILGCMSFGDPASGGHPWTLNYDQSRDIIHAALDAGITVFDTANVYSAGTSEEITGKVLREAGVRDQVIVATKVHGRMGPGPKESGLSRAAILEQAEASLQRLETDHIDLYQIHRLDPEVPPEEILEALNDLVRSGKVRYIGASSMQAWQFAQLQYTADLGGWTRFVSMQDQYNLLMREEEREMLPFCLDQGVGVIPWSPLARGVLAREWDTTTKRSSTDQFAQTLYTQDVVADKAVSDAVGSIAAQRSVTRAQVALAWLLSRPAVTAPIVGATRVDQLADAVGATDLKLDEEEISQLEAPYTPRYNTGF
ncbi:MAG: aldo/keto reductase [Bifidobacteriaceae bacterium]|nr:aldo/keto reductase [Bifidobacteriaceae bacterium]